MERKGHAYYSSGRCHNVCICQISNKQPHSHSLLWTKNIVPIFCNLGVFAFCNFPVYTLWPSAIKKKIESRSRCCLNAFLQQGQQLGGEASETKLYGIFKGNYHVAIKSVTPCGQKDAQPQVLFGCERCTCRKKKWKMFPKTSKNDHINCILCWEWRSA